MRFGPTELLIILGIVILLFGVGRVGRIGGELGQAVRNFREGLGAGSNKNDAATTPTTNDPVQPE